MIRTLSAAALVLAVWGTAGPPAAAATHAFTGARILPVAGPALPDGTLVIRDGVIVAVGPADAVTVPSDAQVVDLRGRIVMPGLVDTHSHLGGVSGGDASSPINPEVRALDSIDVRAAGFTRARAGGITTVNIMPGSGHLMSGQTVYLKLRRGETLESLLIRTAGGRIAGGMKMANGTNSRKEPPFPGTRAKSAALVRQAYTEALAYRERMGHADPDKRPARDLGKEALLEVLDGTRVVHHHTHRHDDIMTVLRLAQEFGYRVVLQHVSEGWKVAAEIAAAGAPCSVILVDSPGGKLEARDLLLKNAALLEAAGVLVGFHTDDGITDSRFFFRMAALGVRAGMSRDGALAALTINNAKMMELDHRVGTLEAGKDADFIILSGDPLSTYTRVLQTWVEGEKVFDLDNPEDQHLATGGLGAADPRAAHDVATLLEGEWGW